MGVGFEQVWQRTNTVHQAYRRFPEAGGKCRLQVHVACLSQMLYPAAARALGWRACLILLFSMSVSLAAAQDAAAPPDCKCRSPDGQMLPLGSVQCVSIVGRQSLVRCEMSTNTPYWKAIDGVEGCPDA